MKTKIVIVVLVITSGVVFLGTKKGQETKEVLKSSFVASPKKDRPSAEVVSEKIVADLAQEEVVASPEEIEQELLDKSNEELKLVMEKNNAWAKERNFIALANTNQLDKKTSDDLLKYIRLNMALNKILIDRQIEEMERERL